MEFEQQVSDENLQKKLLKKKSFDDSAISNADIQRYTLGKNRRVDKTRHCTQRKAALYIPAARP